MPGCNVTRREMLRWTALAAALPRLGIDEAPWLRPLAGRAALRAGTTAPVNLELVTLTEERAVLTWFTGVAGSDDGLGRMEPTPADAVVVWGTDPARLDRQASSGRTDTPYHRVELTGLEPGRTYYYSARSAGQVATPTPFGLVVGDAVNSDVVELATGASDVPAVTATLDGVYRFTAPHPPPGRFLFSVVLCNDLHLGETVAGLVGSIPGMTGISQVPGGPPYPAVMTASMIEDAAALGAQCLLAAGDISAEAEPADLAEARRLLDRFGAKDAEWFAARGNHDRAHEGAAWASCRVGRWQGNDCFVDEFFPGAGPTWLTHELGGLRIVGLDTYDKPGGGGDAGELGAEQLDWFGSTLADDPDRPTLVFGHHPLKVEASAFPVNAGSALDVGQAGRFAELYDAAPGVFLHHAGHTHRNRRAEVARTTGAPPVVHQEVAAVKEYPGGFTLLRVFTGGYALNFHKATSDDARAWSERSRMQIGGAWPQFSLGARVSDRNVVVARDLSGLSAPATTTTTVAVARPGANPEPTGRRGRDEDDASPWPVVGATAVVAATAAAGVVALRRRPAGEEPDTDTDTDADATDHPGDAS